MFEVHTQGRVFFLSAPSEDEMQSWVGMLQTLKQYNRVTVSHSWVHVSAWYSGVTVFILIECKLNKYVGVITISTVTQFSDTLH